MKTAKKQTLIIHLSDGYEFKLYLPAKPSKDNKPYLFYYFINPLTNLPQRVKRIKGLDFSLAIKDLKVQAKGICEELLKELKNGYNPLTNTYQQCSTPIQPSSPINDCMAYWLSKRKEQENNFAIKPRTYKQNKYLIDYLTSWLITRNQLHSKPKIFNKLDIDNFLQTTANTRNWSKVSYNTYRTDLGTFFNFLVELKIITENPVARSMKKNTTKDSSRFKIFDESELREVVKLLRKDKAYLGLYIATKLIFKYNIRPVELTRLQVKEIDFNKQILTLPPDKTKNGNEAIFKLDNEMFMLFDELVTGKPLNFYVFGHRCKPSLIQIHQDYFGQKWRFFRAKYNLPEHLKLYALKHTSNYYDIQDGANYEEIRQRNRHANLQVTTLYIKERLFKNEIAPSKSNRF